MDQRYNGSLASTLARTRPSSASRPSPRRLGGAVWTAAWDVFVADVGASSPHSSQISHRIKNLPITSLSSSSLIEELKWILTVSMENLKSLLLAVINCIIHNGYQAKIHLFLLNMVAITRTCRDGGQNPTFQEKFVYTQIEGLRELNVNVWNSNTYWLQDDFIGSGKVQLEKALSQGFDDRTWPLQSSTGRHAGEVLLVMRYSNANKPAASHVPAASSHAAPQAFYSAPPLHPSTSYPSPATAATYPPVGGYPAPSPYTPYPPHPDKFRLTVWSRESKPKKKERDDDDEAMMMMNRR